MMMMMLDEQLVQNTTTLLGPETKIALEEDPSQRTMAFEANPIKEAASTADQSTVDLPQSSPQSPEGEGAGGRNLFVSGFTGTFSDAEFRTLCEPYGEVLSAKVMLNIHTGENRGFGFALFSTAEAAAKAFAGLNGQVLHNVPLRVAYSEHRGENLLVESNKLYSRNIPSAQQLRSNELIAHFQKFGRVLSIQNKTLRTGSSQTVIFHPNGDVVNESALVPAVTGGMAMMRVLFVEYETCDAAGRCVEATHNSMPFPCCTVPVLAKIYEPQDLRVRRLQGHPNPRRADEGVKMPPQHVQVPMYPVPPTMMFAPMPQPPPTMVPYVGQPIVIPQQMVTAPHHAVPVMSHPPGQQPLQPSVQYVQAPSPSGGQSQPVAQPVVQAPPLYYVPR